MNNNFDELTKSMAQSVTRRSALKKFGVGLAGLACFGLVNKAQAQSVCLPEGYTCRRDRDCCSGHCKWSWDYVFLHGKYKVYYCAT